MMKRVIAIAAVTLVVVAGCGGDEDTVVATSAAPSTTSTTTSSTTTTVASTATQPEPGPVAEVSDAVASAAQALIELPAIQAVHADYDENGDLTTTRWLDWRVNGDLVLVVATKVETGGIAQVGADLLTATSGELRNEPWTSQEPPLPAGADPGVVLNFDLVGLANGGLTEEMATIPLDLIEVHRAATEDGGTRWSLHFPFGDVTATREWTVDAEGRLRSYLLTSDADAPVFGAFATAEFRFDPLPDPPPIALPEEGSDLDLETLNLPDDLRLPGQ